jgi:hypothetical protein
LTGLSNNEELVLEKVPVTMSGLTMPTAFSASLIDCYFEAVLPFHGFQA